MQLIICSQLTTWVWADLVRLDQSRSNLRIAGVADPAGELLQCEMCELVAWSARVVQGHRTQQSTAVKKAAS